MSPGPKSGRRRYTLSAEVTVRAPEGGHERRTVRYTYEIDTLAFRGMVARAVHQSGGRARSGPVTVYVHPSDRAARARGARP